MSKPHLPTRFRQLFWLPPRPHGEVIHDRTVSFLELFYDLVFVVLIAQAAHTLAGDVSWRGFGEFAVVFGLIWIAWLNGTLHHELHGREDGRSRTFIFLQMLLLAVLAVYTGDAAGSDGAAFAAVYTILFLVLTWLWYAVRRQDEEHYMSLTGRYLTGMMATSAVMAITVVLEPETRVVVWGALVAAWMIGAFLQDGMRRHDERLALDVTDSMVERFGLFTIIVLGETVVGVVDGLSEVDRNATTLATGVFSLGIGFGFWWTFFDFVGRRLPEERKGFARWIFGHFPTTLAIAAAGAAMVSLIEHATDDRAPAATAWLIAGSVALMLLSLVLIMSTLRDAERYPSVYRPLRVATVIAAAAALGIGAIRPSPVALVVALFVLLSALWWFALDRFLRSDASSPFG